MKQTWQAVCAFKQSLLLRCLLTCASFQLKELGLESDSDEGEDEDEEGEDRDDDKDSTEEAVAEAVTEGVQDVEEEEESVDTELCHDEVESLRKQVEDSVVLWNQSRGIFVFTSIIYLNSIY
jgi:hypothetical protein